VATPLSGRVLVPALVKGFDILRREGIAIDAKVVDQAIPFAWWLETGIRSYENAVCASVDACEGSGKRESVQLSINIQTQPSPVVDAGNVMPLAVVHACMASEASVLIGTRRR